MSSQPIKPSQPSQQQLIASLRSNMLGLVVFSVITTGLVSCTQQLTKQRIQANIQQAQARMLYQLAPASSYWINLQQPLNLPAAPQLGHTQDFTAYLARATLSSTSFTTESKQPDLLLLPLSSNSGYSGTIHLLLALDLTGNLSGFRVVSHQETPGLGDKIEAKKSNWHTQFIGTSLASSNWALHQDGGQFDSLTGATITSRAIVNLLHSSLIWLEQERHLILDQVQLLPAQPLADQTKHE